MIALAVGGAFHTPLMNRAQSRVDAALERATFTDSLAVVANVDALPHRAAGDWPALLSAQLCRPVRWREGVLRLRDLGVTRIVELGPGGVLTGMVKRIAPELDRLSLATPDDVAAAR